METQAQRPRLLLPRTFLKVGSVPKTISVVDSEQALSGLCYCSEVRVLVILGAALAKLMGDGRLWGSGLCPQSGVRVKEGKSWPPA